jgi:hypothetical protein
VLLVAALGAACAGQTRGAELYPEVAEFQNEEIDAVRFMGGEPFADDTLRTLIDSAPSRCSLLGIPICIPFLGTRITPDGRLTRRALEGEPAEDGLALASRMLSELQSCVKES